MFGNNTNEPCHAATFATSVVQPGVAVEPRLRRGPARQHACPCGTRRRPTITPRTSAPRPSTTGPATSTMSCTTAWNLTWPPAPTPSSPARHRSHRLQLGDRCLNTCATHDEAHWPDTPWDLNCAAGATCAQISPTFWTTKRLATVTTRVYDAAATGSYRDVERWTFTHTFPDPGDDTRAGLWLDRISHAGLVGATSPADRDDHAGRVVHRHPDARTVSTGWTAVTADELRCGSRRISTETGAEHLTSLLRPDCVAGTRMPVRRRRTTRCGAIPVHWTPEARSTRSSTTSTSTSSPRSPHDRTGSTGPKLGVVHYYQYLGDPAWHYTTTTDSSPPAHKSWSQWRGYGKVGTIVGGTDTAQSRPRPCTSAA